MENPAWRGQRDAVIRTNSKGGLVPPARTEGEIISRILLQNVGNVTGVEAIGLKTLTHAARCIASMKRTNQQPVPTKISAKYIKKIRRRLCIQMGEKRSYPNEVVVSPERDFAGSFVSRHRLGAEGGSAERSPGNIEIAGRKPRTRKSGLEMP